METNMPATDRHTPALTLVDRFMSTPEVLIAIGIKSRSTLQCMVAEGLFPRPVQISRARVAWPETEVKAWQSERIAARDAAAA
jgi:prophage regulatory protein